MTYRLTDQLANNAIRTAASCLAQLCLALLCFALLILSAQVANAADSGEESTSGTSNNTESSQEDAADAQSNASGSQQRRAGDKGGVFSPSEDISEDVAITFPVDI